MYTNVNFDVKLYSKLVIMVKKLRIVEEHLFFSSSILK